MKLVLATLVSAAAMSVSAAGAQAATQAPPPAQGGAASAPQTLILPGYWEYSTKVLGIGPAKKKCLKAEEVDDFLSRPCNRHYTCVYPTKQIGNGKLLLDGYWQNKEGKRAKVHASGTYQPKSFSIRANGTAIGGIPFLASMDAKWLGADCPAGAS